AAGNSRMRGVCEDRRLVGSSPHLPAVRRDVVLRHVAKSSRQQTCARHGSSGGRFSATRRTLVVLLSRQRIWRILNSHKCGRFFENPAMKTYSARAPLHRHVETHEAADSLL